MSATAWAAALAVSTAPLPIDNGWQEAVVSVADLDDRLRFFRDVVGWEVVERAPVGRDVLEAWRLPAGARGDSALLRAPGTTRGYLRLIAFSGAGRVVRIRSSARPWESGGWSGLNVRVGSIEEAFSSLLKAGWQGFSDPVTLKVPPYTVREVMMVGPDGLTVAMIERLDPPLKTSWKGLWSQPVTVFEVSGDSPASRRFYGDSLSLKVRLSYDGPAAEPGMNLFGLPHDLVGGVSRRVDWWQEQKQGEGTIASLTFSGATGRRFAEANGPPHLGLFLVAMPVSNAEARCRRAAANGSRLVRKATELVRPPYGRVTSCIVATPDGSWLELFTPAARKTASLPDQSRNSCGLRRMKRCAQLSTREIRARAR